MVAIVASSASKSADVQVPFVAVKGVATTGMEVSGTIPIAAPSLAPSVKVIPQSNLLQAVLASPHETADYIYIFFIVIFGAALLLHALIQVRILHPQLIFNGVAVIAVAALFVVLNQHLFLGHAAIF